MRVRFLLPLLVLALMVSCGGGKKKKEAAATVPVGDFVKIFPIVKLPFTFSDTVLARKSPDSLKLSKITWRQLLSDSLYDAYFGDESALRLYAVGKVTDKQKGNYLLVKAISDQGRSGYLFYFDRHNKLMGSLTLVTTDDNEHTLSYGRLDNKLDISVVTQTRKAAGLTVVKENVYGLAEDGTFALMMTNSNDETLAKKVFNPIDTLSHRFKWSGDYVGAKSNIVSLRDGAGLKEYRFFIHFVGEDGTCKGDLKGVAEITGENKVKFTERSGPCGIEFRFDDNHVTIREVGGCGAYRGVNCFFEGTYVKKKAPKTKKKK
jgi:hypothetical protein